MTATYSPAETERLIAEAREDDARMTRAPWGACDCGLCGLVWSVPADAVVAANGCDNEVGRQADSDAIARTRNNLRAMADQLEAARATIERMAPVVEAAEQWRDQMYPRRRATDDSVRICDSPILRTVDAYRVEVSGIAGEVGR